MAAFSASADFVWRVAFLRAANQVVTSDVVPGSVPVSPEARVRSTILPATSLDTRWWVIHAEESLRTGKWRIRGTKVDNAPEGRDLHWSSGVIWLLRSIAYVSSTFSGRAAMDEIQNAPFWVGPITLVVAAALLGSLVGVRFGWGYGGLYVLLLFTSSPILAAFRLGEADHHGIALMFALGSVLSVVFAGCGLVSTPDATTLALPPAAAARKWFVAAGLLGSAAMWVSAASTIPILGACALGAMVVVLTRTRGCADLRVAPELWRVWGAWGCAGSIGFYLVEYFPSHLGWRLEVNHPLYALAWLAGGDLLARICQKLAGGRFFSGHPQDRWIFAASVVGVLVAPILILWRSDVVFWVRDPFLLSLHTEHIREFAPLIQATLKGGGGWLDLSDLFVWPVFTVLGAVALFAWFKASPVWRPLLIFALVVAATLQAQAMAQVRWSGLAVALWTVGALLVFVIHTTGQFAVPIPKTVLAAFAGLALFGVTIYPQASIRASLKADEVAANLPQNLVPTILLRDIAHRLVQSSTTRVPIVLSDPTSSTELSYYGGLRTLGTLYWDNAPGLKRAARIFASATEAEARERLLASKVTHIVIPSWDGLSSGSAHLHLLQKSGSLPLSQKDTYLDRVFEGKECPNWLRPFYYPIPPTFGFSHETVKIFEVVPEQTPFEAYVFQGVYHAQAGTLQSSADMFQRALQLKPGNPFATEWLARVSKAQQAASPSVPQPR